MKIKLKATLFLIAVLGALLSIAGSAQQADDPGVLLRAAIEKEEVDGDLQGAIDLYKKIIAKYGSNRAIAAKAQLHIGFCYEKLGKAEAIKAYELVLEKYSGQKEQVAMARARLAELKRDKPAGISVVDLDFDIPGFSPRPFDLSPDGTKMLGVEIGKGQNIVVCDLENQKVKFITHYDWSEKSSWTWIPIWSPDGKEIAYNANEMGSDGKSLMKSTLNGQSRILLSNKKYWFFPNAWMPDGKAILTIRGEYKDNTQELGLVPSEGGEFKKLISLQGNVVLSGGSRAQACVSPDGRFIAFTNIVLGGEKDIFVMSSDGKTFWPLVGHPAAQEHPRWSPDGKYIVFLSLRHGSWALWGVAVEEGKAKGDPFMIRGGMEGANLLNWTSNGLASNRGVSINDIFLLEVNPATGDPVGEPRILGYTPTGGNRWPTWSPDGKHIAFLRVDKNSREFCVTVVRSDESGSRDYPIPRGYGRGYLRWSPDGNSIGMYTGNIVLRLNLATEKWETIRIPVEGEWSVFEWSANGKAFFYAKKGHADMGAGIIERDLKTGEERYVYRPKRRANFRWLKCSRDYKWLAFLESNTKVMVVNLETGESHLAAKDVGPPSWSSDGQKIMAMRAYKFGAKEHLKSLFVLPSSGGPVKEFDLSKSLPKMGSIMTQDWSPDGKQVVLEFRQSIGDVVLYKNVIPEGK